jgi:hypothetical protein
MYSSYLEYCTMARFQRPCVTEFELCKQIGVIYVQYAIRIMDGLLTVCKKE